jgi:hypothetical protein
MKAFKCRREGSTGDGLFGHVRCYDEYYCSASDKDECITDSASDEEGMIIPEWRIMKRWSKEEIENDGQESIDDEICKLARVAMRKSFLLPHPEHVVNEWDIGLWTLAQEYTEQGGKVLVRIYKCPMWDRFKCGVSLRIQEGAFGMIMESLGSHNIDSHLERGETGPILRFIKGKQLFREEEIPEVIAIQEELERANPQWKTEQSKLTINDGDFSSGCPSKDVAVDGSSVSSSDDDDESDNEEAERAHVIRKVVEGEMDSSGVRQWLIVDDSKTAKTSRKSASKAVTVLFQLFVFNA